MNIDILISQLDEHNQPGILASKLLKPKEVLFIYDKKDIELIESLNDYYKNYLPTVKFSRVEILEGDILKIKKIININKNRNLIINLTGGSRVNSLILSNICKKDDIESIYIDLKNKKLYKFNDEIEVLNQEYEDLNLSNLIKASGGELLSDESTLCDKKDLVYLTEKIYTNLNLWHKYKQKLYDNSIFIHDYNNHNIINVNLNSLDDEEKSLLDKILNKLKSMNGLNFKKIKEDKIEVIFKNDYLKSFIFKSGTWLEIATNIIVSEIKEIDDIKSGVMFFWNEKNDVVRNEADVVAVKDSIPIYISCKDSNKYNENALNELNVYSEKIGGDKTIKILVATKEPTKGAVRVRAKEMGINLVIFDGNKEKLKNSIKEIIKIS